MAVALRCNYAFSLAGVRIYAGMQLSDEERQYRLRRYPRPSDIIRTGNCPVSIYDPIVTDFQLRAAFFVCHASDDFISQQNQQTRGVRGLSPPQPQPQSESTEAPQ